MPAVVLDSQYVTRGVLVKLEEVDLSFLSLYTHATKATSASLSGALRKVALDDPVSKAA